MALRSEPASQSLEKKLLIAGFEVPDILLIFLLLSILNFTFGGSNYKLIFVWLPVVILALLLRLGKRGKPENYVVHFVKFQIRKKHISAFASPANDSSPRKNWK